VGVVLPFRFDTSPAVVSIMRGVLGLLLIVTIGAAYAVAVSRRPEVILGLVIIGLIVLYFGRLFLANLTGSRGTISVEAVTVEPVRLYGLRLAGPEGTFPITRFRVVRVERVSPPTEGYGGPHARVYLAGGDDTPDVFVARSSSPDEGRALGRGLSSALGLPFEERSVAY
jgi:hypothetical protein